MTNKISAIVVLLVSLCAATAIDAQSMFRGVPMHSGTYAGPAPRQFHRVKWKFPRGRRRDRSPNLEASDKRTGAGHAGRRERHSLRWQLRRKILRIQRADRRVEMEVRH